MSRDREYFPRVRKTVIPRPQVAQETDVLGVSGTARASEAAIFGPNWHHDRAQDLIEIWDAGPALCFGHLLPHRDKYARENLYLELTLSYRTTANANANIRTLSGSNVTLDNAVDGAQYRDPYTIHWITDDCTLNINSLYSGERIWIQRIDWEWVSRETIYDDELAFIDPYLHRTREEVDAAYEEPENSEETVRQLLVSRIHDDPEFAKRCLLLLSTDALVHEDMVTLYARFNGSSPS